MPALPTDFGQFLVYFGTPIFAAWVVSSLLETWSKFQALTPERKNIFVFILSLALSLTSYALVQLIPASVITQINPIYNVIEGTIMAYLSGTVYHMVTLRITATTNQVKQITPPTSKA